MAMVTSGRVRDTATTHHGVSRHHLLTTLKLFTETSETPHFGLMPSADAEMVRPSKKVVKASYRSSLDLQPRK